jgi:YD repeat-containing protein
MAQTKRRWLEEPQVCSGGPAFRPRWQTHCGMVHRETVNGGPPARAPDLRFRSPLAGRSLPYALRFAPVRSRPDSHATQFVYDSSYRVKTATDNMERQFQSPGS